MEEIVCVAILGPGDLVLTAPRPLRHHDIINTIGNPDGGWRPCWSPRQDNQGFLTSYGRFVDREKAWEIAKDAGQITPAQGKESGTLYSEDVW